MEINDQNLAQLSEVLKQTLNPDATERKKAEVHHVTIFFCHFCNKNHNGCFRRI